MPDSETVKIFHDLLRKRGVKATGDAVVEREILTRFQDDCAVMVLDSCGFTRLTQKHGIIHFLALVVSMHDIARPIVVENEAIGHWTVGDNLFAVFPSARRAVQCAIEIQASLKIANDSRPPTDRLDVSIGLGCGKMLRIGASDVYGDPMNIACKLGEDVGEPGEILIDQNVQKEIDGKVSGLELDIRQIVVSGVQINYYDVKTNGAVVWK